MNAKMEKAMIEMVKDSLTEKFGRCDALAAVLVDIGYDYDENRNTKREAARYAGVLAEMLANEIAEAEALAGELETHFFGYKTEEPTEDE